MRSLLERISNLHLRLLILSVILISQCDNKIKACNCVILAVSQKQF